MSAARYRFGDPCDRYGWLSIGFHWATVLILPVIWFAGESIAVANPGGYRAALFRHVSLALGAYIFLWLRILWRLRVGHPAPLARQSRLASVTATTVHYALLALIAVLLVTGPLILWTRGEAIPVFGWTAVQSPFAPSLSMSLAVYEVHSRCATWLAILVILHLCGVFKRLAFNRDGTFDRIMSAKRRPPT